MNTGNSNWLQSVTTGKSTVLVMTVAGLLGGFSGWALSELIQGDTDRFFSDNLIMSTGFWFLLVLTGIGLLLSATQGVMERNPEKSSANVLTALPALVIGGFVAGAVAQAIFSAMLEDDGSVVVARTIAWGIAGGLGGLAVGIGFRSKTRIRNCALGGLGGGLLGGLLFDYVAERAGDDVQARLIGIVLIGTLMGLFIGLLDSATTDMFLELASGEQRGQQFVLFDTVSIAGCARTVAVTLTKDPLITEQHVRLTKVQSGLQVEALPGASPIRINNQQVQSGVLPIGGSLQVGNTVLVLKNKKSQATTGLAPTAMQQPVQQAIQGDRRPSGASPAPPPTRSPRPTIQMPNKPKQ